MIVLKSKHDKIVGQMADELNQVAARASAAQSLLQIELRESGERAKKIDDLRSIAEHNASRRRQLASILADRKVNILSRQEMDTVQRLLAEMVDGEEPLGGES